jgi:hypothetical protein
VLTLRAARRLPEGIGAHTIRPFRTGDRGALSDLIGDANATVQAVRTDHLEDRLRFVAHRAQLVRSHLPWIAPDAVTIGRNLGSALQFLLV